MADDNYTFEQARIRLEEIVGQVRKKDTSLERSLDLLEEGVRLANSCTELVDHTEWRSVAAEVEVDGQETATEEAAEVVEAAEPEATDVAAEPSAGQVYDYETDTGDPDANDDAVAESDVESASA